MLVRNSFLVLADAESRVRNLFFAICFAFLLFLLYYYMTSPNIPEDGMPADPFGSDDVAEIMISEAAELYSVIKTRQMDVKGHKLAIQIAAGESFAIWLAKNFPNTYGGNNTLDPLEAYKLLQELRQQQDR